MEKSKKFYKQNILNIGRDLEICSRRCTQFSIARLVIVILSVCTMYYSYKNNKYIFLIGTFLASLAVFFIVAYIHTCKLAEKEKLKILRDINENGMKRVSGEWRDFEYKGEEFLENQHGYANDLDILGEGSLFQWINSARTKFGKKSLANILINNNKLNKQLILDRQEAVKELASKVQWRQKLEAESTFKSSGKLEIKELIKWSKSREEIGWVYQVVPYIFIMVTIISVILSILRLIPLSYLMLIFMMNYLVVKMLTKKLRAVFILFQKHKSDIEAYSNILALIENERFESKLLLELQKNLNNKNKYSCNKEMKNLKNLVDWVGDSSLNAYYLIFNITFLLDIFILRNLEIWRVKNGENLELWLEIMGEFEALSSISNIAFDFNEWKYPEILDSSEVKGKDIGHPMLCSKAKCNDFSLIGDEKISLITGSNMSGKSTFLRTIGVNLILAYIGAPTYSSEFSCGVFSIYTCMRTRDNLEENISSFYAEILRIKYLLEATKKGEKVFFLLDEIFKGTNSKDRYIGAKVLIKQLIDFGGVGLVSTHDLELCDLEKENKWLVNYNFQEYYSDGEIKFDYKLRSGKSTTTNAIHLMQLAGITFVDRYL